MKNLAFPRLTHLTLNLRAAGVVLESPRSSDKRVQLPELKFLSFVLPHLACDRDGAIDTWDILDVVDAPNLERLEYGNNEGRRHSQSTLEALLKRQTTWPKLRQLYLADFRFSRTHLHDLLRTTPALEHIALIRMRLLQVDHQEDQGFKWTSFPKTLNEISFAACWAADDFYRDLARALRTPSGPRGFKQLRICHGFGNSPELLHDIAADAPFPVSENFEDTSALNRSL